MGALGPVRIAAWTCKLIGAGTGESQGLEHLIGDYGGFLVGSAGQLLVGMVDLVGIAHGLGNRSFCVEFAGVLSLQDGKGICGR